MHNRRDFLAASAAVAGSLAVAGRLPAAHFKTKIHKAMIGSPAEGTLKAWKDAGFDGMESGQWNISRQDAEKARKVAESVGMKIHSVLFGWANFNQKDKVDGDIANVQRALEAAAGYGASAVLLVPCRTGGMAIPAPWDFKIAFDSKTGHISQVVAGDNEKYQAYIDAHNQATDTSREAVKRLIETAEKTGVKIALENVWNNLWVQPAIFANFVRSFAHPMVKAYFDIGNHVKYAPPEEWIRALGKEIVKLHVKDFKLNANGRDGTFVHPRDGSVNWPAVRTELDDIGYNDFMTIEDGGLSLAEFSKRLDLIVAGK